MKNSISYLLFILSIGISSSFAQSTTASNALSGTQTAPTQFLGSNNNFDVVFKSNNAERMRITAGTTGNNIGNVGIGISAPTSKLHIDAGDRTGLTVNTVHATGFNYGILSSISNDNTKAFAVVKSSIDKFVAYGNGNTYIAGNAAIGVNDLSNRLTLSGGNVIHKTSGGTSLFFSCNDGGTYDQRIGIGTVQPTAKLQIETTTNTGLKVNSLHSTPYGYGVISNVQQDLTKALAVQKNGVDNFMVYGNGTVYAREINVKLGTLGDFVFDKNYNLKQLSDVEKYVNENKHLPGIPSAKEVAENGLQVGEFQNLLLQKVEELTLYVIQLEKGNKELSEKVTALELKNK